MNPISRGIRNAFRNGMRSVAVVLILSLSIGLGLTMLVANKAVANKIASVKSSIGTTVSISPAGFSPGSQANNALSSSDLNKVKSLAHITGVAETLSDRLSTTGSGQSNFGPMRSSSSNATTSLTSPTKLNGGAERHVFVNGGGNLPTGFSLPISFLGTSDPSQIDSTSIQVTSGKAISGSSDANEALVSSSMAGKNSLKVGSTFTAYDKKLTVAGIFKSSNQGASDTVVLSLPTEQNLSGQSGTVTSAVATVDSLDNLSSATASIKNVLGSDADVISSEEQANNTVKPLNSVKTVSFFSLIGAVVAGAVIILLVMMILVRERKREIGVVKAIGSSNRRIISEFTVEALTITLAGAVIGLIIGVVAGQPVTNALVDSSTSSSSTNVRGPGGRTFQPPAGDGARPGGGEGFGGRLRNTGTVKGLDNINAEIGWGILLDGLGVAVLIAIIGSALAAGVISKVRPSEILRSV